VPELLGAVVLGAELPLEPEPLPPMFGQLWPVPPCGAVPGCRVPPFGGTGWLEPPDPFWVEPPADGVVALGAGEPAGSAAKATAAPPTTSRPAARTAVAMLRRRPLVADRWAAGGAGGVDRPTGWAGGVNEAASAHDNGVAAASEGAAGSRAG
jgi:hypothetical protein